MSTETQINTAVEAKALAVRMFFLHGTSAAEIVRARVAAARQAGDDANAARWQAVLAAIEAPIGAESGEAMPGDCGGIDAMLACWRRLHRSRPLTLAA
jgi:hypothetical protein